MLKYIFLLILILTMVLIYFIKFKKNHLKSRKFNRTYKTLKQENNRSSTREIYQNITALINDRNFFAAEAQIQHAFIHGDIHKLKKGAILAINTSYQNIKTTKNNVLAQKNIKNYLKSEIKYSGHLSQLNLMTRNVSYHFQMLTQET